MFLNLLKKFKKPQYFISLILILGIGAFIAYIGKAKPTKYEFTAVSKRDIVQSVSATGRVKPVQSADLGFESGGRVAAVYVKVGDKVSAGKTLAVLESSELATQLQKAEADLSAQNAKVEKAKEQLAQYYGDIPDTVRGSYTTADTAVHVKTAGIFSGYKTTAYTLNYVGCSLAENEAENLRLVSETELETWKTELDSLGNSPSDEENLTALAKSKSHLDIIKKFLYYTGETLNTGCTLSDSSLDTYRTNISAARASVDSAIEDLNGLNQQISLQKTEINSQIASIASYEAAIKNVNAQLGNKALHAPISGTISKVDVKAGEIVSPNSQVISLISASKFQIEVNIPEADIDNVKINDQATITLDAYGRDVVFEAKVISIDPAETIIEGVPTYKTTLYFTKEDSRIKSGMTANLEIAGERRLDVLAVPQRSLIRKNEGIFVKILKDEVTGETEEVKVQIGLRGSDGYIEINEGLKEGDKVITFGED